MKLDRQHIVICGKKVEISHTYARTYAHIYVSQSILNERGQLLSEHVSKHK